MSILGEGEDKGIVIFDRGMVLATFDVKYCPICGEILYKEGGIKNK